MQFSEVSILIFLLLFLVKAENKTTIVDLLNDEQRHERLLKVRMKHTTNSLRYKPSNKLQGDTKLLRPIKNHATSALHVNPSPKKFRQPNSSEYPRSIVKIPKPTVKYRKSVIHSSGTDQSKLAPSRLYLLLDHELKQVRTSREMTRTTMSPSIFRLKVPSNVTQPADNHYGTHSRIIVDADDEVEASGLNELEELDSRVVPFQPRNKNWHLKTDEYSKSQLIVPPKKLEFFSRELHRSENTIR